MNQILIVEDEARLAAFVKKGLQKNGFATMIATDGEEAVLLTISGDVDLMLLDLGLPVKDGWTVLRELRNRGYQLPIIILTAFNDEQDKKAALAAGANDYVSKPFRFQDLLNTVQAHLH